MSLNYDAIYRQMRDLPQVAEATQKKAEELRDFMEIRWPGINDISDTQRAFLQKSPEHTVLIASSTRAERPTHVVTVRHPGAVAAQAKYGFVTKAVKDVS